ncbi:SDR family oxidoreductase [Microbaculum marinum]|uniref:SDR family oxidoreductase n=1 Tax=Microbaculum marinum TaxID=1764581 RepID=A0AAW9RXC3_9HYPH
MTGVMIVTGASRGIGAAVAELAARQGYAVCMTATSSISEAEAGAEAIRQNNGRAIAVRADVGKEADIMSMFETVERELGPVTVLVNNAGITGRGCRVEDIDLDTLSSSFGINVLGSYLCAREAVRRMSTAKGGQGGAIVNVSSRLSELGGSGEYVHYAACKGAINSFTVGLAREVATEGIRVNAVSPGVIDTSIHVPGRLDRLTPMIPVQRPGTAMEVAETVMWLASDAASYITGAVVPVSGGR